MPTEIRMAKRELSSTLKNLKFMQRASNNREEKAKEPEDVLPDGIFPSSSAPKRCVVIMEGDPHPGAIKGRMSFQNFNPAIDKLNEEELKLSKPEASETSSRTTSEINSNRENGSSKDGATNSKVNNSSNDAKGDNKRKQDGGVSDVRLPKKTQKNGHGHTGPSSSGKKKSQKYPPKCEGGAFSALMPPKHQNKKQ